MKKHLSTFGAYLWSFVASLWFGLMVQLLANIPIKFLVGTNRLAQNVLDAVVFAAAMSAWLFYSSYRRGHKQRALPFSQLLAVFASVILVQQIIAFLFGYVSYTSGAAYNLSVAVFLQNHEVNVDQNTHLIVGIPLWGYHVMMLSLAVVCYLPALIGGQIVGARKREKEREKLTGEDTP